MKTLAITLKSVSPACLLLSGASVPPSAGAAHGAPCGLPTALAFCRKPASTTRDWSPYLLTFTIESVAMTTDMEIVMSKVTNEYAELVTVCNGEVLFSLP
jgi:hypothetical protein